MRRALIAVCVALVPVVSQAQDVRVVEQLKSKGFQRCAESVGKVTEFLYGKDTFAFLNTWNDGQADSHAALTQTAKAFSDGVGFGYVSTSPARAAGCDASFTSIFVSEEPCARLRETTFQGWKFYSDMAGVPVYEHPTSPSIVVTLSPVRGACLVIRSGLFFYK